MAAAVEGCDRDGCLVNNIGGSQTLITQDALLPPLQAGEPAPPMSPYSGARVVPETNELAVYLKILEVRRIVVGLARRFAEHSRYVFCRDHPT